MNTIDKAEEKRLIGAIERAITSTNQGVSPDDAISKVASEEQFSPQFIHRMVESFNKSKSVHRLKEAAEGDRHKEFALADPDKVMSLVFDSPMDKAASSTADCSIPTFKFGIDKMMAGTMQKSSAWTPEQEADDKIMSDIDEINFQMRGMDKGSKDWKDAERKISGLESSRIQKAAKDLTPEQVTHEKRCRDVLLYKQAHVAEAVKKRLHTEVVSEKYAFDQAIEKACDLILPMSNSEFRKVAQIVHNGYPQTGNTLVQILSQKTRKTMGDLQKTANAVVFPAREPYITIGNIYGHAEKLAAAENECRIFEKEAIGFLTSAAANALGNVATPGERRLGESLQGVVKKKTLDSDEVLDPEFYNRLRELDARRSLMTLVLHDPDLKNYKYSDIVKAYNTAVSSVPEAAGNSVVLKTLVMKNLESSGIKDVVELAQEQTLAQSMVKSDKDRNTMRQDRMEEDELPPEQPTAVTGQPTPSLSLEERARSITEGADSMRKAYKEDATKEEEKNNADMDKWQQSAQNILRKGEPGKPMDLNLLGKWITKADGTPSGGRHSVKPAMTIHEIAQDLKEINTVPQKQWRPATITRARHQYNAIT